MEELVEVRFKRSPMHASELAGHVEPGMSLEQVLMSLGKKVRDSIAERTNVFITNADAGTKTVEPRAWDKCILKSGDRVVLVGVPGFVLETWQIIVIILAVSIAVAILLRPSIPKQSGADDGGSIYSFGGGTNRKKPYSPIPVVYGTIECPLSFIAQPAGRVSVGRRVVTTSTKYEKIGQGRGNDPILRPYTVTNVSYTGDAETDYLRVLGTFGPGPVVIEDIKIGDVPIEEIKGEHETFEGNRELTQPVQMPHYSRTNKTESIRKQLNASGDTEDDWITFRTLDNPVSARFDIALPSGLFWTSKKNRKYSATVRIDWQYKHPDAEWSINSSLKTIQRKSLKPFFESILINFANPDRYPEGVDIRLRRNGLAGQGNATDFTELIRFESSRNDKPNNLAGNYSLMSARIKADARISGNIPVITAKVSRKIWNYENYAPHYPFKEDANHSTNLAAAGAVLEVSSNPAWIYLDALFGVNGENRIELNQIDWETFKEWAVYCDQEVTDTMDELGRPVKAKNAKGKEVLTRVGEFNGLIEKTETLEKTLRNIAASGYAAPIIRGTLYSVFWEGETSQPVALLTPATTTRFQARRKWEEEVHGYRVSYADPENDYKPEQVIAYQDGYSSKGEKDTTPATIIKNLDAKPLGATNRSAAWRQGRFRLAYDRTHQESYQMQVGLDSLVYEVGDIVALSHDVLQIGQLFGRIVSVSHRELPSNTLSRIGHAIGDLRHVTCILLDQIIPDGTVGGFLGYAEGISRIRIETSRTSPRTGVFQSTGVFSTGGTTSDGQSLDQYFAQILEVSAADVSQRGVLLISSTAPLLDDGVVGSEFSIGPKNSDVVRCVVQSLTPRGDKQARITLQAFKPEALSDSWRGQLPPRDIVLSGGVDFARPQIPPRPGIISVKSGVLYSLEGESVADVYVLLDSVDIVHEITGIALQWRPLGSEQWQGGIVAIDATTVAVGIPADIYYELRVAFINNAGLQGLWETTSRLNETLGGVNEGEVFSVTGLQIEGSGNNTEFYGRGVVIGWRDAGRTPTATGVVGGSTGGGQSDDNFDKYLVSVYHEGQFLRRDESTVPLYHYSAEMATQDMGPYRTLRFEVLKTYKSGIAIQGEPAVLDVFNSKPSITTQRVSVDMGEGYYAICIDNDLLAEPDFREVIISSVEQITPQSIIARGYQNKFRIDVSSSATEREFDVWVAAADTFGGELNDWNKVAVHVGPVPRAESGILRGDGTLGPVTTLIPPTPEGLVVSPAVQTVVIEFTDPTTLYPEGKGNEHGVTRIYRGANPSNLEEAVNVGETRGNVFVDGSVTPGQQYLYWIRFVSVSEIQGPPNTVDGTLAEPQLIPNEQVGELSADKITFGQMSGGRVTAEGLVAESVLAGSKITSPVIETAYINQGSTGRYVGGYIDGAIIRASRLITGTSLTGQCVPHENADRIPLSALLEEVSYSGTSYGAETRRFEYTAPTTSDSNGYWTLVNPQTDSGATRIVAHSATSTPLEIPASNWEDADQVFRYRWPEIDPVMRFTIPTSGFDSRPFLVSNTSPSRARTSPPGYPYVGTIFAVEFEASIVIHDVDLRFIDSGPNNLAADEVRDVEHGIIYSTSGFVKIVNVPRKLFAEAGPNVGGLMNSTVFIDGSVWQIAVRSGESYGYASSLTSNTSCYYEGNVGDKGDGPKTLVCKTKYGGRTGHAVLGNVVVALGPSSGNSYLNFRSEASKTNKLRFTLLIKSFRVRLDLARARYNGREAVDLTPSLGGPNTLINVSDTAENSTRLPTQASSGAGGASGSSPTQ